MANKGKKAFLIRIDPKLWDDIEKLAASELRSLNSQVEYLLREAVDKRKGKRVQPHIVQQKAVKARR